MWCTSKFVHVTAMLDSVLSFQIHNLQQNGAVGVIVLERDKSVKDMNCATSQCLLDIHIPATSVPYDDIFLR